MILTPLSPDALRRALGSFGASLEDGCARRAFARIARPRHAARAHGRTAVCHHTEALKAARRMRLGLLPGPPQSGYSWDGKAARDRTEAYVLLHEIAHFQLAAPARRRVVDFGLGAGPETSNRPGAEAAAQLFGVAREREEAMASLLGILWEAELGHPALASFLDQNWLEGVESGAAARHFTRILQALREGGFIAADARPTPRLRQAPDPG